MLLNGKTAVISGGGQPARDRPGDASPVRLRRAGGGRVADAARPPRIIGGDDAQHQGTAVTARPHVGFVGLGAMSVPMARNLLARGFRVRGFDVRPSAADALAELGGERAASAAEACRDSSALVLMVINAA